MRQFTCLPKAVANWLQVLRPMFRHRHHLVFCWLLVCQSMYQEKATVKGPPHYGVASAPIAGRGVLERSTPRLVVCGSSHRDFSPPPDDGMCNLIVESTLKSQTGRKHPLAKKYRLNDYGPYIFGLHLVVVMLQ
jgi:hypothetical protein